MAIRLGNTFEQKYLNPNNFISEKITEHLFLIKNKTNAPMFKGTLSIAPDGKAIMEVDYISYSNVVNKYKNYFDKQGKEIVSDTNNEKEENKYFLNL
jgi:hypothetical protein